MYSNMVLLNTAAVAMLNAGQYWNSFCISSYSCTGHWIIWFPSLGTDIKDHASSIYDAGLQV